MEKLMPQIWSILCDKDRVGGFCLQFKVKLTHMLLRYFHSIRLPAKCECFHTLPSQEDRFAYALRPFYQNAHTEEWHISLTAPRWRITPHKTYICEENRRRNRIRAGVRVAACFVWGTTDHTAWLTSPHWLCVSRESGGDRCSQIGFYCAPRWGHWAPASLVFHAWGTVSPTCPVVPAVWSLIMVLPPPHHLPSCSAHTCVPESRMPSLQPVTWGVQRRSSWQPMHLKLGDP